MFNVYCIAITVFSLINCATTPLWSLPETETNEFHPLRLQGVEASNGFADLEPLKQLFKDSRVIAVGEATHGTREFFQFKHRFLEFLVREMRCRLFAIEASYADCIRINDYVLNGRGNCNDVLAGLGFWCWNTEEVAEMIDWMRDYNQHVSPENRVQFLGFDCQMNEKSGKMLSALLAKGDPNYVEVASALLAPLEVRGSMLQMDEDKREHLKVQLQIISEHLTTEADRWESSPQDYEHALFLIRLLKQECESAYNPFSEITRFITTQHPELKQHLTDEGPLIFLSDEFTSKYPQLFDIAMKFLASLQNRDKYMAENILTLLSHLSIEDRMMIWAHNGHIGLSDCDGIKLMGSYLQEALGDSYYALGCLTSTGTFQALKPVQKPDDAQLAVFSLPVPPDDSWGEFFTDRGEDLCLFDFRAFPKCRWLNTAHFLLTIGNQFSDHWPSEESFIPIIPRQFFDGIVYIRNTSAARPTGTFPY